MKKTKILTVMGVLLAMGITACGGNNKKSSSVEPQPSSSQPAPSSSVAPSSSSVAPSSSSSAAPTPTKDATGHIWGADADVAASGEGVAYKKATCTENDGWIRLKINQSAVTYASGSSRKENTPEGYTKLDGNGQSMSAKFNYDHYAEGKLYLYGCMDGWGSNASKKAFSYNGSPNIEVKVNGEALDIAALSDVVYTDFLSGDASDYSDDGYGLIGNIKLDEGVNEVSYKRLASMNTLVKDFVFVIENKTKPAHVHTADAEWHKDETNHWHECTAGDNYKMDSAAHTFGDPTDVQDSTCSAEGSQKRTCTVCGYVKEEVIAKKAHTYEGENDGWVTIEAATDEKAGSAKRTCTICKEVEEKVLPKLDHVFGDALKNNAAGEGYIATTIHNCSAGCNKSALRWNARDFDKTLSSTDLDLEHDGDKSVRFASGAVENKGGAAAVGSHIIYNVNVAEAVEKASLSFKIKNTNGSGYGANVIAPVFGTIAGDSSLGAIANADGTFTTATKRYGLKVNDVEYFLGEDGYGNQSGVTGWFDWPVEFPLKAGVNKVDIFAYAGYRADIYEVQFTGLPAFVPTHQHTLGDYQSDENNHWKECSGADCDLAEHAHIGEEPHTWGEKYDEVAATCSAKGSYKQACTVCGYVKTVETDKAAHTWGEAQAAIGDAIPHECTVCHAMCYELAMATPQKVKADVEWNVTGLPAGKYEVYANACAASTTLGQNMQSRYQFGFDGTYVALSARTAYSVFDFGTGEDVASCQWSKMIMEVTAGEGAAKFGIHWVGNGYSAFFAGIRLVKVA